MNRYMTLGDKNQQVINTVDARLIAGLKFTAYEIMNELNAAYQAQWGGTVKPFGEHETRDLVHNYMATYNQGGGQYVVSKVGGATLYPNWQMDQVDYPGGTARTYSPLQRVAGTSTVTPEAAPDKVYMALSIYDKLNEADMVAPELATMVQQAIGNAVLKWLNS